VADALALVGNPSSVHAGGRAAHALLESARDAVARFAGVAAEQIIFTSGGTEAIALAATGARLDGPAQPQLLVGATEHSAVLQARADAVVLPVDGQGVIDLAALADALAAGPALVAVQAANNETGVIQPIAEVAALVRAAGGLLLVDAVQAAGKMPLPEADFIAISAHKLGGPPGVGALIVKDPGSLIAVQRGGGQERGYRGGTPNLPGIAGFAAAVAEAPDWAPFTARRARLEAQLQA
uniref:cysteine desulfurase family protein n=1 Tax=Sandarakinorhabdus oryzae TaxID=2675220 RepID=UPI0012E284E3